MGANIRCITKALEGLELCSPAYVLWLATSDDPEVLVPAEIALGVEDDRRRVVEHNTPWDAWVEVWNGNHLSYDSLDFDDPSSTPDFAAAAGRVVPWLAEAGILDYARWVLEEVAARLTRAPPPLPVTDDFVTFVYSEGDERGSSLRWIAPPDVQEKLQAKRLLVDDPDRLEGAPTYGWSDDEL